MGNVSSRTIAGDYTGLGEKGAYAIGNIDLRGGDAYDSDGTQRWRVKGTNLGLDSRRIDAEYGEQGKYKVKASFDDIPKERSDTFTTFYNGVGSGNLTLPGNWRYPAAYPFSTTTTAATLSGASVQAVDINGVATTDPSKVAYYNTPTVANTVNPPYIPAAYTAATAPGGNLALVGKIPVTATGVPGIVNDNPGSMHQVDIGTERKRSAGGISVNVTPDFIFAAGYTEEHKTGNKIVSAYTTGQVFVPEPVDYTTRQFDTSLSYTTKKAQFQLSYYGSLFENNISMMDVQNPFSVTTAAGTPAFGQWGLPPDNQFHQFNATGGYNFDKTTRLTVNASWGVGTQDQAFTPYAAGLPVAGYTVPAVPSAASCAPYAYSSAGAGGCVINGVVKAANTKYLGLPITSLGGEVDTTNLYAQLTARPIDNLRLLASYKYDDRDDQTPSNGYRYVARDGEGTNAAGTLVSNHPRSATTQTGVLEADYTFLPRTSLKLGYDWQEVDRTNVDQFEQSDSTENAFRIELRNTSTEFGTTERIGYAHSVRKVSDTGSSQYFVSEDASGPGYIKFMYADRDRDRVHGFVSYRPPTLPKLNLSADVGVNHDDYSNSPLGLTDSKGWDSTLSATYTFSKSLVVNAFYTHADARSTENDCLAVNATSGYVTATTTIRWRKCFHCSCGQRPSCIGPPKRLGQRCIEVFNEGQDFLP
ncbi:MAG: MtrB/PioB family outer membrane beta-barrel protein, partial [Magnetococcales bacterium]|nr:MtrB/PioB family outer membrane beta-barrel protein [Magnetococcales bacterium]